MIKLTPKQQRFVDCYEGNATDAARQAGYNGNNNTLGQVGDENLKKPKIAAAIKAREGKRRSSLIATREERQQFWSRVLRGEETQTVIIGKGDDAQAVSVPPAAHPQMRQVAIPLMAEFKKRIPALFDDL